MPNEAPSLARGTTPIARGSYAIPRRRPLDNISSESVALGSVPPLARGGYAIRRRPLDNISSESVAPASVPPLARGGYVIRRRPLDDISSGSVALESVPPLARGGYAIRRRLLDWLAALVVSLLALGAWFEWRLTPVASDGRFNRSINAAWLGVEWVNETHPQPEIAVLARDLSRRQIRTVYVYTTYLRPSGEFGATYTHAAQFTRTLKATNPDLSVQAWIGLPLDSPGVLSSGYVVLNATTRQKIATFSAQLVQAGGFDGLHLDPEPIVSGDTEVLALLEEVRAALPQDTTLSIATRRIWPFWPDVPWPLVGAWAWRGDYYREVARRVDQIALMTYDSALPTAGLYRWWGRRQVVALTQVLADSQVEVLVGIPTSEERTLTHWPNAETMTSGLHGVLDGLTDPSSEPTVVTGVAIYPYWETDDAEWAAYEALWLGR